MSDHLTDEQLDAMQASADQATPGPWEIIGGYQYVTGVDVVIGAIDEGCIRLRDAEFIAHARTDVPALVAEVRRLRRWKAEALPILDGLQELGHALDLPIGERITGPAALDAVERLREQRREALALANVGVAQWERDNHTPAVWAADIRDALEADDA